MGLLDDAIREHLDLKRKRGADPAEIERAEREALGPVRRGPVDPEPPELMIDEGHAYDEAEGAGWDDQYDDEGPAAPLVYDDHPEPARAPLEEHRHPDDDPFDEDDPFADHGPAGYRDEPAAPPGREQLGETVEYDVEEAFDDHQPLPPRPAGHPSPPAAAEPPAPDKKPAPEDDDMLEETPEFLQDAPDHDRLWFEQKPPRDFDFDG
jgi:hypothetical protein